MTILIDFDGTCVYHDFPNVGKDIGAAPVLRELVAAGHKLILWTIRSDGKKGMYLTDAVKWFRFRNIELYGINENPQQKYWSSSPKAYGELCIDDINLGAKLSRMEHGRPFINWSETYRDLRYAGLLGYNHEVQRQIDAEIDAFLER